MQDYKIQPDWLKYPRHVSWCLRKFFQSEVTIETSQGLLTMSTRDSGLAAHLYRRKQYEFTHSLEVVRFLKKRSYIPSDGGLMLDVGANIGIISIGLIRAGEVSRSVAIEPEQYNFKLLLKNIKQNGLEDKILAVFGAIGESEQELTLALSTSNFGDHRIVDCNTAANQTGTAREVVTVPTYKLETLLSKANHNGFNHADFLWIDIQGYEGHVFRGNLDYLKEGLPTVTEVWPDGIETSGMTLAVFSEIVCSIWSHYWIKNQGAYVKYETKEIPVLLADLKKSRKFTNIILTNA